MDGLLARCDDGDDGDDDDELDGGGSHQAWGRGIEGNGIPFPTSCRQRRHGHSRTNQSGVLLWRAMD